VFRRGDYYAVGGWEDRDFCNVPADFAKSGDVDMQKSAFALIAGQTTPRYTRQPSGCTRRTADGFQDDGACSASEIRIY